jgi:predicted kinase
VALPTLVVVSGPAASGKTTLAHELARAIGCPAVCRDEIKEGLVHATGQFEPETGDALTTRTLPLFFATLGLLLEGGVTVVAEAAFQDEVWTPNLAPFSRLANLRIVQCHTDPRIARRRMGERATSRRAHADAAVIDNVRYFDDFRRVAIAAPSLDVDTTSGYEPSIERVVAFINDADPHSPSG